MAFEDSSGEGSVHSDMIGSSGPNRIENDLSPDDFAWVDSCIINDPENANGNWNALRDVLLEIVDNQPEMVVPSIGGMNVSTNERDMNYITSPESEAKEFLSMEEDLIVQTPEEAETVNYSSVTEEDGDIISSLAYEDDPSKNSFQSSVLSDHAMTNKTFESYSFNVSDEAERAEHGSLINNDAAFSPSNWSEENLNETSLQDNILQSKQDSFQNTNFSEGEIEISSQDIFRVWDLEVPGEEDEEDEFEKQLRKALSETSKQTVPPPSSGSLVLEDMSVDDLIAGISDLSLDQSTQKY